MDGWYNPNKTDEQREELMIRREILNSRINLPLDVKIKMAQRRIREVVTGYGKNTCYVSFSGGKTDTVLSHLIVSLGYKLEHVYINTQLKYSECIKFSSEWCKKNNVKLTMVTPDVSPREIWETYGYPMFSRRIATILEKIRNKKSVSSTQLKKVHEYMRYKELNISAKCCEYLKKKPQNQWQNDSDKKVAIVGDRAVESIATRTMWLRKGCVYETEGKVKALPLMFFRDKDIWEYIKRYKLKVPDIYYNGIERNSCYCCGFGAHLKGDNNFVTLKKLNPRVWKTVMHKWGFREICNQCNVKIE